MKICSWGANSNAQLGHGYASEQIPRPLEITGHTMVNLVNSVKDPRVIIQGGGNQVLISLTGSSSDKNKHQSRSLGRFDDGNKEQKVAGSTLIELGAHTNQNQGTTTRLACEPKVITTDFQIQAISCGWDFNLILAEDNQVYSYGETNKYGQLGRSTAPETMLPIPDFKATAIAAGMRHAAAVSTEGDLFVWGDNTGQFITSPIKIIPSPRKINNGMNDEKFVKVKCGKSYILALDEHGQFWGCGSNKHGQLGAGPPIITPLSVLSFKFPSPVLQFACGWNHILVLLENRRVVTWGRNNFAQLGRSLTGDAEDWDVNWNYVEFLRESVRSIACGAEHNLALCQNGRVYSWGWNEHDNCGVKSTRVSSTESVAHPMQHDCVVFPCSVDFGGGLKIHSVACGSGNGFVVADV